MGIQCLPSKGGSNLTIMEEFKLLKTQRNQVAQAIVEARLNLSDFEWQTFNYDTGDSVYSSPMLVHLPTRFFCQLGKVGDLRSVRYSPAHEDQYFEAYGIKDWAKQLVFVHKWLSNLKREMDAPDLWAVLVQEKQLSEAASSEAIKNTPFAEHELTHISASVAEIKEFLFRTQELNESHQAFVTARLNYLEGASRRGVGRVDWFNLTVSVLTSIVLQVGLNPDAARELFRIAGGTLQSLLGGPALLP